MIGGFYNKTTVSIGGNCFQKYIVRRLTNIHEYCADSVRLYIPKVIAFFISILVIIVLPYVQFGLIHKKLWTPDKPAIDRKGCSCGCFDTINRGSYESPGFSTYKHIYFNSTRETFAIWAITVIFVVMFYESIKHIMALARRSELRATMFVLYLLNVYPNYYSWWIYYGYYNEEFYHYYYHQLFFSVTELISTAFIVTLCDQRTEVDSWRIRPILSISSMHVASASADQFIENVIRGRGKYFQVARDVGFMVPDVIVIVISLRELFILRRRRRCQLSFFNKEQLFFFLFVVIGGTLVIHVL